LLGASPLAGHAAQPSTAKADSDWRMYNGSYAGDRFSRLRQITRQNVGSLDEIGSYQLPETTSFSAGPIVVGDTLYVTTATSTYAVDATSGKLLWSHKYAPKSMGLGTGVRGVAFANGRLYRGTPDAHLLALDAKTGKLLWDAEAFDSAKGEYIAAAPLVWEGRIYIGNAGSDVGGIGHMRAFDLKDGHRLWNFDIVPTAGPGADSWPADPAKVRAGGGMYSSYALDTSSGRLYIPTGNPGPDFSGEYRPGANAYTASVLELDARTGALRAHHQFAAHDVHDWDIAASPMLYTSKAGHKMVAVAGKNGYLYTLPRDLSKVAYRVPVTTIENVAAPLTAEGTRFCPGTQGGVNWNGPAYSRTQNAIYVDSIDWCTIIKLGGPESLQHKFGQPFLGSSNAFGDSDPNHRTGWLYAVDADSGKVLWKYHATQPLVAAVTPTAGGVVFTGDLDGNLLAFDAASGKLLLTKKAGGPIGGGIVTYSVAGKQYVAVAAGMKNGIMQTESGPASVAIFALPSRHAAIPGSAARPGS
jgi:PQQ-dependent dehydrogenase (methanol/ethanol family)